MEVARDSRTQISDLTAGFGNLAPVTDRRYALQQFLAGNPTGSVSLPACRVSVFEHPDEGTFTLNLLESGQAKPNEVAIHLGRNDGVAWVSRKPAGTHSEHITLLDPSPQAEGFADAVIANLVAPRLPR